MTREEALKVLLNEWKCIDRNDGVNCDRKCESCDLVMDSFVLKDAYNTAIKALEQEDAIEKIRAEIANHLQIMDICDVKKVNGVIVQSESVERKVVLYDSVMQIIDKYKEG